MLISKYHGYGGSDSVINHLCEGLNKLGYQTSIGAFSFQSEPPQKTKKIKLNRFQKIPEIIDGKEIDIIHSHQTLMNYYSLFSKKPFIFHYHGSNGFLQEKNLKLSMLISNKKIKKIIAVSNAATEQLKKIVGISNAKVIYNGVDIKKYNPDLPKPFKMGTPQLLFVGNLYPTKNVKFIVKSMKKILEDFPKAHLQIVGGGTEFENIKSQINKYNLEKQIELVGRVSNEELPLRCSSCDIYMSASKFETFGLPIIESMACGKPAILSNIPPHKELVEKSNAGILFENNDVPSMKEGIKQIISNYETYSNNSRKFAEKYDWLEIAKNVSKIYEQIM